MNATSREFLFFGTSSKEGYFGNFLKSNCQIFLHKTNSFVESKNLVR